MYFYWVSILSGTALTYCNKTWHVASGTRVLQCVYTSLLYNDLDLFYGKVKLGHKCRELLKCRIYKYIHEVYTSIYMRVCIMNIIVKHVYW